MPARSESADRPVLEAVGVWRSYRRGQETVEAVRDVSLTIAPGELTLVLGPSGGGKSTLLHLLGGMDRPTKGEVRSQGVAVSRLPAEALAVFRRRKIGFVFQSFYLLPHLTAADNVAMPLLLDNVPSARRRQRALQLLAQVGLADRAEFYPGQLSGGEAQRVAIARALAADPPILIADEPTGDLDSASGQQVMELLAGLAHQEQRAVVVVTHNESFVPLADRVFRIRDGRLSGDESAQTTEAGSQAPLTAGPRPVAALVGLALKAAWRRPSRSILTGLGVAVGIAAMVLLVSVGAGLSQRVTQSILSEGPLTTIFVSPQAASAGSSSLFTGSATSGPTHPIFTSTIKSLASLPGAVGAWAEVDLIGRAMAHSRQTLIVVTALPPHALWPDKVAPTLSQGRLPLRAGQAAISASIGKALFPAIATPSGWIGQQISVLVSASTGQGGSGFAPLAQAALTVRTFTVSGVLAAGLGSAQVAIPYSQGVAWFDSGAAKGTIPSYPGAEVVAGSAGQVSALANRISKLGFGVTSMSSIVTQVQSAFSTVEVGLGVVGGIALVVAGLMIAVVMAMAVLERRREIGVLRALGSTTADVFFLFLTEATVVGFGGAAVGLLIGWGLGKLAEAVLAQPGLFLVQIWLAVLALVLGTVVALVAGAIPAGRAARLNPVEALRQD
ncbi:MAG: ABC transporter ATP-binding protein/permease [Sulfobacillus sp.]